MNRIVLTTLALCIGLSPNLVFAHFIWLSPTKSSTGGTVSVYFGEDASDDNAEYLSRVDGIAVTRITGTEAAALMSLTKSPQSIFTAVNFDSASVYVASHRLGVMERGDSKFNLQYYAKTGPPANSEAWQTAVSQDDLRLDLVPSHQSDHVVLTVRFDEKPIAGVQIKAVGPQSEEFEVETGANGQVKIPAKGTGLYSIRARHVEPVGGEIDGEAFTETRHYSTLALMVSNDRSPQHTVKFQDVPAAVTSFGAAVIDRSLYMYGGHTGSAHSYSMEEQCNTLTRLDLQTGQWDSVIKGPHLQGLALVAHGTTLYRIGGFTAMNKEGEEHNLVSQNLVAAYAPSVGEWQELPALPERRSSHDAAVVGDTIYVVGGWAMDGDKKQWHSTAWKMDLTQQPFYWQPIKSPGFERRALATAAHDGKLYVVGGMQSKGGPTTATAVYDPASDKWAQGPSLTVQRTANDSKSGEESAPDMSSGAMTGFGASVFATGGRLYATTVQGDVQRLSKDGSRWDVINQSVSPRFFHRLLPLADDQLIVVGGSNMSIGKFEEVEVIEVPVRN